MFLKIKENNNPDALDSNKKISNTKLLMLFIVGIVGLYLFGTIAQYIVKSLGGLSSAQVTGISNFITYSLMLVSLLAVLNKDIKKLIPMFKDWKPYIYGIIIGFTIIAIQSGYSSLVNLYYPVKVSDNEGVLRSFITIYPITSIIILAIVGPMCEEMIYRVGLFGLFSKHKVAAYIISILVFTLMHFNPLSANIINELINLPMYLLAAIALTIAFDKYGLSASLTAHCLNNFWSVVGIIIISNLG